MSSKPFRIQTMLPILNQAMSVRRLKMENIQLKQYLKEVVFESARYRIHQQRIPPPTKWWP